MLGRPFGNRMSLESYWKQRLSFWSDGTIANGGTELVNNIDGGSNATLTNQLITNSGMENDFNPFDVSDALPTTNERSATQAHSGTYSRHLIFNNAGQTGVRTKYYATKNGETVTWSFWVYKVSGAAYFKYVVKKGDGSNAAAGNSTEFTNGWRQTTGTYVEDKEGKLGCIILYLTAGSGAKEVYVDDISVTTGTDKIAVIMPFDATAAALDTSNLLYDASGFGLTKRVKAYEDIEGSNKSVFLYPGFNIMVAKAQMTNTEYYNFLHYFDYGQYFYDNLENVVTVGAGRDYATIPLALAALTGTYLNRYRLDIYDDVTLTQLAEFADTYGSYHWYFSLKDYIYINGRDHTLTCSIPETATDNETTFYEPCAAKAATGMKDFNISMKNGRYAMHIDDATAANKKQEFFNCTFRHYSNQEVIDYRIANAQAYAAVFQGITAVGMGSRTGQSSVFKDCTLYAIDPLGWHTNVNFTTIAKLILIDTDLVSLPIFNTLANPLSEVKSGLVLDSLMSQKTNTVTIWKGSINGGILYAAEYYEPTATNLYILNDITVSYYGISPTWSNIADDGGALKITSATAGAVDTIAGTGATALTTATSDYASNYGIGRLEVGEWSYNANVKMGVRLGNCSVSNKTMTLNVDGVAKTITFNQNFTAQTNAQVLAFIDAALAGSATASLYQRASENTPTILT